MAETSTGKTSTTRATTTSTATTSGATTVTTAAASRPIPSTGTHRGLPPAAPQPSLVRQVRSKVTTDEITKIGLTEVSAGVYVKTTVTEIKKEELVRVGITEVSPGVFVKDPQLAATPSQDPAALSSMAPGGFDPQVETPIETPGYSAPTLDSPSHTLQYAGLAGATPSATATTGQTTSDPTPGTSKGRLKHAFHPFNQFTLLYFSGAEASGQEKSKAASKGEKSKRTGTGETEATASTSQQGTTPHSKYRL